MPDPHEYMQAWVNLAYTGPFLLSELSDYLEGALGITAIEQEFLGQVGKAGGELRMVDVAHNLRISKGAVTKIVDRLAERRLVLRRPSRSDRRVTNLVLTEEGGRVLAESRTLLRGWVAANFAQPLTREEVETLGQLLRKLLESHGQWEALQARLRGIRR